MEKYPRGSRGSPAKGVVCDERSAGSNPAFSAKQFRTLFSVLFVCRQGVILTKVRSLATDGTPCRTAILLSLCDISLNKGIALSNYCLPSPYQGAETRLLRQQQPNPNSSSGLGYFSII